MKYLIGLPIFIAMLAIDMLTSIVHHVQYDMGTSSAYKSGAPHPTKHHGFIHPQRLPMIFYRGIMGQVA